MAKGGERKKTNRLLDEQMAISNDYSKGYISQTAPERDLARDKGNQMYDVMLLVCCSRAFASLIIRSAM